MAFQSVRCSALQALLKELYLVENAHELIIDQETFDKVQKMKGQIKRAADMQMKL